MTIANVVVGVLVLLTLGNKPASCLNNSLPNSISATVFLERHLDDFVKAFNDSRKEDEGIFSCKYVENKYTVFLERDNRVDKATLLDFNGENGYTLITDNYELLDFSTNGEPPFKGIIADKYYFSPHGGFYYEINGAKFTIDPVINSEVIDSTSLERKHYNGQKDGSTGFGSIEAPDTYIKDCYGDSYKLVGSKSLPITRFSQMTLSCYLEVKEKGSSIITYSEGNCGLVAAYHVLQCFQKTKWSNLPAVERTTLYDPYLYETDIYLKKFDITGKPKQDNVRKQDDSILESWPLLYKEARMCCVQKFGKYDGLTVNQTSAIIENVAKDYNRTVDAREDVMYKFSLENGIDRLKKNEPLAFSTLGDETYGNHTVAVCGFRRYQGKKMVWIFEQTETIILYELADGHETRKVYYDMSATSTLGSLVFIDIK